MKVWIVSAFLILAITQSSQARVQHSRTDTRVHINRITREKGWRSVTILTEDVNGRRIRYSSNAFVEEWEEGCASRSCVIDVSHLHLKRVVLNVSHKLQKIWDITPGTVYHKEHKLDCNSFNDKDKPTILNNIFGNYYRWRHLIDPDLASIREGRFPH
jgi:hypothetical protein